MTKNPVKVGVFDSGVGGQAIVNAIQKELLELEIIYKDDKEHLPYGTKTVHEIHEFVRPIFQQFVDEGCKVIVVACNTVTTNLISQLRRECAVPIVGLEPAIKPAATLTRTGIIAVCATPRTLASNRYKWLKDQFAAGIKVLEPNCSDWALMIEANSVKRDEVATEVEKCLKAGADVIVLGCTHYHWIEELVKEIAAGRAQVIQPTEPVIAQLKRVLGRLP